MRPDRRKFLHDTICCALGGAGLYSTLGSLQLVQAATRATSYTFPDYKALVCVFLNGGNDGFNTVVPIDGTARAGYNVVRPSLALASGSLNALTVAPSSGFGSTGDGCNYGLHASMADLAALFNTHKAAIVANVGTLVTPVSKTQFQNGHPALPPQLFSHADQSAYWQSSPPTNAPVTGWGGRIADLLASANPANIPMLTSVGGPDAFLRGVNVNGYVMNASGPNVIDFPYEEPGTHQLETTFNALQAAGQSNALERTLGTSMRHSMSTASLIRSALNASGMPNFDSHFTGTGRLGPQLKAVAQLIWAANNGVAGYTGLKRQVFYVSIDGFDTHSNQLTNQVALVSDLSKSLSGFYAALDSASLANAVTAFTGSEFGRSLSNNQNGTDHGWASHHFVVGGAVHGGQYYGDDLAFSGSALMPSLNTSATNPNDGGYGQMIPTTSVDQYMATLAQWFGLSASDIALIMPNLANFTTKNLGFV